MVPLRDRTTESLLEKFRDAMHTGPDVLTCVEEGILDGHDDWDEDEESSQVKCWWGIFARSQQ